MIKNFILAFDIFRYLQNLLKIAITVNQTWQNIYLQSG